MIYYQKKSGLNRWLSCIEHTKQNKQRNKNFKWAIQFLAILHLVGCKTNDQRGMVLINLQKAFDIINHKILLKKMYSVEFSAIGLSCTSVYQFSSEYFLSHATFSF